MKNKSLLFYEIEIEKEKEKIYLKNNDNIKC